MDNVRPKALARKKARELFDEYLVTGTSHELGKYIQTVVDMYPKVKSREEANIDKKKVK